jgi:hypothetical protein
MITEREDRWYSAPAGSSAAIICLEGIITHVPTLPDVRCTFQKCKHWEVTSGIFVTSKTAIIKNSSFITWPLHVHNIHIIWQDRARIFFSYKAPLCAPCGIPYYILSPFEGRYKHPVQWSFYFHTNTTQIRSEEETRSDSSPGFCQQIIWVSDGWTDAWIPLICLNENKPVTASAERIWEPLYAYCLIITYLYDCL